MTRFGKISPLKQKFRNIFKFCLVFGKVVNPLQDNLFDLGQFFIVVNGQISKKQSGHLVTLLGTLNLPIVGKLC